MFWTKENNKLVKTFEMKSFNDIISRLQILTSITDRLNHHPDFRVYDYKKIEFTLTTHSEGGVTEKDESLSKEIDQVFE